MFIVNVIWIQMAMPIRLAFEEKRYIATWVVIVDTVVDFLYLIDSILTFFLPLINNDGTPTLTINNFNYR